MADDIRERICQESLRIAQSITKANGYETNLGSNVERSKRKVDVLPGGALWPGTEASAREYGASKIDMQIDLEVFSEVGDEPADRVCNRMAADVRKAFGTHDATLYALIEGIQYAGLEPLYPDPDGSSASAKVSFIITYKTLKGDPYSQPS